VSGGWLEKVIRVEKEETFNSKILYSSLYSSLCTLAFNVLVCVP
jgi:hypothetical protein